MGKIAFRAGDSTKPPIDSAVEGKVEPSTVLPGIGLIQWVSSSAEETQEKGRFKSHLTLSQVGCLQLFFTHEDESLGVKSVKPGHIYFPPAISSYQTYWDSHTQFNAVVLETTFMQYCAMELYGVGIEDMQMQPAIAETDSVAWEIGQRLIDACSRQEPSIFLEQLATTLSMHLLTTYGEVAQQYSPGSSLLTTRDIRQIDRYVEANLAGPISLGDLAGVINMSKYYFARQFKAATGQSPGQYIITQKMHHARALLTNASSSISEIAMQLGYSSVSCFSRAFCKQFGCSPSVFRKSL